MIYLKIVLAAAMGAVCITGLILSVAVMIDSLKKK